MVCFLFFVDSRFFFDKNEIRKIALSFWGKLLLKSV